MNPAVTIGLAGGTGAGKTALCHLLAHTLEEAAIVDLDSYYLDRSGLSPEARERLNYDEPSAFDFPLLVHHLAELRAGRPIHKPEYSFQRHVRSGSRRLAPARVVLVEGLFTLWWDELRALLDLKVFVDAPESTRFSRRLQRDIVSRGRTLESVQRQLETNVQPMHRRYVEPTRLFADLVVSNHADLSSCAAAVHTAFQRLRHASAG